MNKFKKSLFVTITTIITKGTMPVCCFIIFCTFTQPAKFIYLKRAVCKKNTEFVINIPAERTTNIPHEGEKLTIQKQQVPKKTHIALSKSG